MLSARWHTGRFVIQLLFAAIVVACLFSMMLPPSASLLAPTATPTRTVTYTPGPTFTPTSTVTPLPAHLITPYVTPFGSYTVYGKREVWESAVGTFFQSEDFEQDPISPRSLTVPYVTGNGFSINGNGYPEIISSAQLLPTGNLLHFRDWEQGITLTFPNGQAMRAFGFDYTSPEDWVLDVGSYSIPLPPARAAFVGLLLYQDFPTEFTFSSSAYRQGGLSLDNIAYVTPYIPSTSNTTPDPGMLFLPSTSTTTLDPATLFVPSTSTTTLGSSAP